MGLLDTYRIKKAIAVSLAQDATESQQAHAMTVIERGGKRSIPRLIEAFSQAQSPTMITKMLLAFLHNDTLPVFIRGLSHTNPLVVAGVVSVLSQGKTYDPNYLLPLLSEPHTSKGTLSKILSCHSDTLNAALLLGLLDTADKDVRTIICRLVEEAATATAVPSLIRLTHSEDWAIRLYMARTLSRFNTVEVRDTLLTLLADPHKNVRQAALHGLASIRLDFEVQPICALLRDPDLEVQNQAIETLIVIQHPQTLHHLLEILKDESEYVRRGAVEVLNAVGTTEAIKDLLGALKDQDWWVRIRAADALSTIGGPRVVDAVLTLIKDDDEFIRRTAVEIINKTRDGKAFESLVEALDDTDWWVKERAVDALGALGDTRAVPALLRVVQEDNPQASSVAIRALGALGDQRAIAPVIKQLSHTNRSVRHEALRALSILTDETHAPTVAQAIAAMPADTDVNTTQLTQNVIMTLGGKFGITLHPDTERIPEFQTPYITARSLMTDSPSPASPAQVESPSLRLPSPTPFLAGHDSGAVIDVGTLPPGTVLAGRYRVVRTVGRGGFGTVLLVEDQAVREEIILKFLSPHLAADERMIKRFVHELRYARRIAHENVIRIHDFLTFGSTYAISMEYFPSHSLSAELTNYQPLDINHGLNIVQEICHGMQAAHNAGVVHRDLKPQNVLIGQNALVKIVDFGLAAASSNLETRITRTGALIGTPMYMAPEQVENRKIDARTDIYSLGIMMYELFTGRPPYVGDNAMAVIFQHVTGKAAPPRQRNPHISAALETIITKAMALVPEDRFQSMAALCDSLDELTEKRVQ